MWRGRGATLPPSRLAPSPSQRCLFYGSQLSPLAQRPSKPPTNSPALSRAVPTCRLSADLPAHGLQHCPQSSCGARDMPFGCGGGERNRVSPRAGNTDKRCLPVRWAHPLLLCRGRGAPVPPYARTPSPSLSGFCCARTVVALLGFLKGCACIELAQPLLAKNIDYDLIALRLL